MPDIVTCPACQRETYFGLAVCPHCGADLSGVQPTPEDESPKPIPWITANDDHVVVFVHNGRVARTLFFLCSAWACLFVLIMGFPYKYIIVIWMIYSLGAVPFIFLCVTILFNRRPYVVLDSRGLQLPRFFRAFVPWSAILDVSIDRQSIGTGLFRPKRDFLRLTFVEPMPLDPRFLNPGRNPVVSFEFILSRTVPMPGPELRDLILDCQRKWYGEKPQRTTSQTAACEVVKDQQRAVAARWFAFWMVILTATQIGLIFIAVRELQQ